MLLGPRVTGEAAASIKESKRTQTADSKGGAVGVGHQPLVPGFRRGSRERLPCGCVPAPAWAAGDREAIAVGFWTKLTPYVFALSSRVLSQSIFIF